MTQADVVGVFGCTKRAYFRDGADVVGDSGSGIVGRRQSEKVGLRRVEIMALPISGGAAHMTRARVCGRVPVSRGRVGAVEVRKEKCRRSSKGGGDGETQISWAKTPQTSRCGLAKVMLVLGLNLHAYRRRLRSAMLSLSGCDWSAPMEGLKMTSIPAFLTFSATADRRVSLGLPLSRRAQSQNIIRCMCSVDL